MTTEQSTHNYFTITKGTRIKRKFTNIIKSHCGTRKINNIPHTLSASTYKCNANASIITFTNSQKSRPKTPLPEGKPAPHKSESGCALSDFRRATLSEGRRRRRALGILFPARREFRRLLSGLFTGAGRRRQRNRVASYRARAPRRRIHASPDSVLSAPTRALEF